MMKNILADTKYRNGLLAFEWVTMIYMSLTLILILVFYHRIENPNILILNRVGVTFVTCLLWILYRRFPNKPTFLLRMIFQMLLLIWWYPETYEFNKLFPNLDHLFANAEQWMFNGQPALYFSTAWSSKIISELMDMGYAIYYPMILFTFLGYLFERYEDMERMGFVILGSFFIYYLIFDLLPVVGPTFYYKAIGIDSVLKGVFPSVGDYFVTHTDCLTTPGYTDGFFYHLVEDAKAAGERPTAAFPSSHVGVATVCMMLLYRLRNKWIFVLLIIPYIFLCLATVYIQAHYVIDAIAGLITGVLIYYLLMKIKENKF